MDTRLAKNVEGGIKCFRNARRIFPYTNESAVRHEWQKNTAGR